MATTRAAGFLDSRTKRRAANAFLSSLHGRIEELNQYPVAAGWFVPALHDCSPGQTTRRLPSSAGKTLLSLGTDQLQQLLCLLLHQRPIASRLYIQPDHRLSVRSPQIESPVGEVYRQPI